MEVLKPPTVKIIKPEITTKEAKFYSKTKTFVVEHYFVGKTTTVQGSLGVKNEETESKTDRRRLRLAT